MQAATRNEAVDDARTGQRHGTLYWDGTRLVQRAAIKALCEELGRKFKPERIVLFGSYAYGAPTPHSDVDLMVIMPLKRGERPVQRAHQMRQGVDTPFALDLLVRTPQFIAERLEERDMFIEEVMARGQVMYESEHA